MRSAQLSLNIWENDGKIVSLNSNIPHMVCFTCLNLGSISGSRMHKQVRFRRGTKQFAAQTRPEDALPKADPFLLIHFQTIHLQGKPFIQVQWSSKKCCQKKMLSVNDLPTMYHCWMLESTPATLAGFYSPPTTLAVGPALLNECS